MAILLFLQELTGHWPKNWTTNYKMPLSIIKGNPGIGTANQLTSCRISAYIAPITRNNFLAAIRPQQQVPPCNSLYASMIRA